MLFTSLQEIINSMFTGNKMKAVDEAIYELFEDILITRANLRLFIDANKKAENMKDGEKELKTFGIHEKDGWMHPNGYAINISLSKNKCAIESDKTIQLSDRAIRNYNNTLYLFDSFYM